MMARSNDICSDMCRSLSQGVYGRSQTSYYGYPQHYFSRLNNYPGSPRHLPPPLPSCPPPSTISNPYIDRCSSLQSHLDGAHVRTDPLLYQNYISFDGESIGASDDKKKSGSVFGRFLRNIGFRKSSRKGSYNKYQGDLSAYEISMGDEDRMALMILVKEGKISTQTALAVVQKFEEERRAAGKVNATDAGKENLCDTPSKKGALKKKKNMKPLKSHSTLSADDSRRCPQGVIPPERDQSCDHQMCRQRRVHSLGQLDVSDIRPQFDHQHNLQQDRFSLTRAMSCSPASTHSHKLNFQIEQSALARLYSPNHHQLQQPPSHYHHHHHGLNKVDAIRERLTGRPVNTVPKTSSKTSLLSSGSDQSMECGMQTPLRAEPICRQGGDCTAYNSNSTVSMNSEANSPIPGRKKSGIQDPRLKNHRSASCSTGDDGISSETDDAENRSSRGKDVSTSRPPLLRQRSVPGSSAVYSGPYLGQAKVTLDYTPGPNERDFLTLKKGDIINIISMAQSGLWMGSVGRKRGKFHFENVKVVIEPVRTHCDTKLSDQKDVPKSVSDLLKKIGLGHLTTLFMLNGYDDLDIFSELDDHDLDTLHISDVDQRTKLLSVARVLTNWREEMNSHPPKLISTDSSSSRAGNSSCDSGCYAAGEGKHQTQCQVNESGELSSVEKKVESATGNLISPNTHLPCNFCGKPKPPRKYSSSLTTAQHSTGQYLTQAQSRTSPVSHSSVHSPYGPGNFRHITSQQSKPYSPGHYAYRYSPGHNHYSQSHYGQSHNGQGHYGQSHIGQGHYGQGHTGQVHTSQGQIGQSQLDQGHIGQSHTTHGHIGQGHYGQGHYVQGQSQYTLSLSRTLSELSVTENHNTPVHLETFLGRKPSPNSNSPLYAEKQTSKSDEHPVLHSDKGSAGDRVSLTEEDQEVIAITYGSNETRKLSTSVHPFSVRSSQLEMSNTITCSACISSSGCVQCDENILCDSMSCQQCAAYMSCPQCFPSKHYVNTTMRSDSKSSKMSCSSTCTQTTCLSPDHDDSSHSGGSNLIDYTTNSQGGYYVFKPSQGKPQHYYYYQQQYMQHPIYGHIPVSSRAPTSSALASAPTELTNNLPASLVDSNKTQRLTLTLKTEATSSLVPPTNWNSNTGDNEAPGIATLYSRGGISQTPDKSEKGDATQIKSPTRSLMPLVSTKLSAEMIDLTQSPYSTAIGHCGIPPLMVQRYSEELRQDMDTMSIVLEHLREKQLRGLGRPCIQNESLSESCKNACDLQISSIQNFLISVGLPMYQRPLAEGGICTLEQLLKLQDSEIEQMTSADSRHLRRIAHALEWVQLKLSSPNHKTRLSSLENV